MPTATVISHIASNPPIRPRTRHSSRSASLSHQNYYRGNTGQGYCQYVIAPKLHKLGLDTDPAKAK